MDKRNIMFGLAAAGLLALIVANPAFAQATGGGGNGGAEVGSDFFDTLQGMITGNVGFFVGLLVTVLGIWTWVIKQQTGAGVIMIIGGVLITLAPGLFNSAREFTASVLDNVGADQSTANYTTDPTGN